MDTKDEVSTCLLPCCPGEPDPELRGEHLHEEPLGVDALGAVDVVLRGVRAVLEPPRHLAAPNIEPERDEEGCRQGHAEKSFNNMDMKT